MFLVRNIKKDKNLPNTKSQLKYIGPFQAHSVTKSHLVTMNDATKREVAYQIHISKKFNQRDEEVCTNITSDIVLKDIERGQSLLDFGYVTIASELHATFLIGPRAVRAEYNSLRAPRAGNLGRTPRDNQQPRRYF